MSDLGTSSDNVNWILDNSDLYVGPVTHVRKEHVHKEEESIYFPHLSHISKLEYIFQSIDSKNLTFLLETKQREPDVETLIESDLATKTLLELLENETDFKKALGILFEDFEGENDAIKLKKLEPIATLLRAENLNYLAHSESLWKFIASEMRLNELNVFEKHKTSLENIKNLSEFYAFLENPILGECKDWLRDKDFILLRVSISVFKNLLASLGDMTIPQILRHFSNIEKKEPGSAALKFTDVALDGAKIKRYNSSGNRGNAKMSFILLASIVASTFLAF